MKALSSLIITVIFAFAFPPIVSAHETEEKVGYPGFRPKSSHATNFLKAFTSSTVSVYPSIVRTANVVTYSTSSQKQVIAFLGEKKLCKASSKSKKLELAKDHGNTQWIIFQDDLKAISKEIKSIKNDAAYNMVIETLVIPQRSGGLKVFGIHCYVLDQQGQNAFSFLLNSHHKMFVDAKLSVPGRTEKEHKSLIEKSTKVALNALDQQIKIAQKNPNKKK